MTIGSIRRRLAGFMLSLGLAMLAGIPATAQDTACRAALTGTYLATIETESGTFASRALVTIHGDGTLSVVDSGQHRGSPQPSFSAQRGAYRCTGPASARARTLDFTFPDKAAIARLDWTVTRDPKSGAIAGVVALHLYEGIEGVDPFAHGAQRAGEFRYTSVRVAVPK